MAKTSNFVYENYLGKTINNVKVDSFNCFSDCGHGAVVNCTCKCGQKFSTYLRHILSGNSKTCGCSRYRFKTHGELIGAVYSKIISSARARKITVEITIQDLWDAFLKQDRKCALSGIEITLPKYGKDSKSTASVDRIDSNKGYSKDNIQWVHKNINFMKQEYTQEEFIQFCKAVAEYNKVEV